MTFVTCRSDLKFLGFKSLRLGLQKTKILRCNANVQNLEYPANYIKLNQPKLWNGSAVEAESENLAPVWKTFILSDGSVTRHLQLLTGSKIDVDCLEMTNIGHAIEDMPSQASQIEGPRVRRQVLLRSGTDNIPLVYACSWWNASQIDKYLKDKAKPIWASLSEGHIELYREVLEVHHGHSRDMEAMLGMKGPFWGRHYIFWHKQQPLTLIYEVFSPHLEEYLGPTKRL
ncbi:hypothetical protein CEUSTIGMA_g9496.t1 [Chlamydomonas eustigma]|uniref:DUF98 domain-containing protein n=1 Tax=Chlamydomonas eustigma TaxID=1157962 RepID=A0A250XG63_9CHLO|nr:hypothetical protein CEUSTIGMA_g9496.t1 [Chlamydomonas eustigma]|eukprot:GAX82068.1 hypothetical protein CEUSTIGMA_g9496.t1 [Chlamydomonas eustigma]